MKISELNLLQRRSVQLLCVAGAVALLAACGQKTENTTAGEKLDAAVERTEQAADTAKAKTEEFAADMKAKADASGNTAATDIQDGAARAKEALKDAGAAVANTVDDATITASVSAGLAKDPDLSAIKIDVDTQKGAVKLSGPAPSAAAKARAAEIAKAVNGVQSVDNQLQVAAGG